MPKLIINIPEAPAREVELKPGANLLGRSLNTDVQIAHPSVSSAHCEIVNTNGDLMVRDLGSTNGTTLDGNTVQESALRPGQVLRLGEVEISVAPEQAPEPVVRMASAAAVPPIPPPMPHSLSPASTTRPVPAGPIRSPRGFFKSLPGAFVFPFRKDGLILLIGGTAFFAAMNVLSHFAGLFSLGMGLFTVGYVFSFMQSIITTTAMGDEEMPRWPDFDGWISFLDPFWQLLAIMIICLGPAFFYSRFSHDAQAEVAAMLLILGLLYLPMALLAVTIYDSLAALNPMLILLSIMRVPLEYAATCLVFGLLFAIFWLASWQLGEAVPSTLVVTIVREFFALYTLTVVMRVAGLLYYSKKDRLGWALGKK